LEKENKLKLKEMAAFIALSFAWGSSFYWIKIALEEIGPFMLVAFRLTFGLLGLMIVVYFRKEKFNLTKVQWKFLALLGVFNSALPFVLISWGEKFIDSGVASILNASAPLLTMVVAHFILKDEKFTPIKLVSLLLGFAGVYVLISRNGGLNDQNSIAGMLAVLLAALMYAFSTIYTRKFTKGIPPILISFVSFLSATILIWVLTFMFETPLVFPSSSIIWGALLWLGLIGSFIAYLLYFYLVHSIGPTRAIMVTYTLPLIGVGLGVLFLGESFDLPLVIGGILILLSIIIVNIKQKAKIVTA
jgi:drug/metabolite transporter (DMT)-like permease